MTTSSADFFLEQAKDELFDTELYAALARRERDGTNRGLLESLAAQERRHAQFWIDASGHTADRLHPNRLRLTIALLASRVLGLAFTIRRLERGEEATIARYRQILDEGRLDSGRSEELREILKEEEEHEREMEQRVGDERVAYLGAAVLGLNDALIELTGGLTGMVSTFSNARVIGFAALMVGFAASLSMAASNFLSEDVARNDSKGLKPTKAALYTGVAYILVVAGLVAPFFVVSRPGPALALTWLVGLAIVAGFSYYSAVLLGASFRKRFLQMLGLFMAVAVLSYGVGRLVSTLFGISV